MTRQDILESASILQPQEIVHLCDRARVDYRGAIECLGKHKAPAVDGRPSHSDTFLRQRVVMKLGLDGLTMWDAFVKLVDSQPKAWRYPAPEEGEM